MIKTMKVVLAASLLTLAVPGAAFAAGDVVTDSSKVADVQITNSNVQTYNYAASKVNPGLSSNWIWNNGYVKVTDTDNWNGSYTRLTEIKNSYNAKHTYNYNVSKKFSNSVSGNVGVSDSIVSAGVGFNVSSEYSVSETLNITINPKSTVSIDIRPIGTKKSFQVYLPDAWGSGYHKGKTGSAVRVTGKGYNIH